MVDQQLAAILSTLKEIYATDATWQQTRHSWENDGDFNSRYQALRWFIQEKCKQWTETEARTMCELTYHFLLDVVGSQEPIVASSRGLNTKLYTFYCMKNVTCVGLKMCQPLFEQYTKPLLLPLCVGILSDAARKISNNSSKPTAAEQELIDGAWGVLMSAAIPEFVKRHLVFDLRILDAGPIPPSLPPSLPPSSVSAMATHNPK